MTNPLTYQDCVELRDAGFPQVSKTNPKYGLYVFGVVGGVEAPPILMDEIRVIEHNKGETVFDRENLAYQPTLSELIAECGDGFALFGPNKHMSPLQQIEGTELYARVAPKQLSEWTAIIRDAEVVCRGSTPEQAVKNLWIALNKK